MYDARSGKARVPRSRTIPKVFKKEKGSASELWVASKPLLDEGFTTRTFGPGHISGPHFWGLSSGLLVPGCQLLLRVVVSSHPSCIEEVRDLWIAVVVVRWRWYDFRGLVGNPSGAAARSLGTV